MSALLSEFGLTEDPRLKARSALNRSLVENFNLAVEAFAQATSFTCGASFVRPGQTEGDPDERKRAKFDLNLRSHLEICHGKQAHADIAEIDTQTVQLGGLGEYLHGGVQQSAFPASPVWFEAPFEDHLSTGKDTVAKRSLRAKITNVQWNGKRLFNRYLGLSKTGVAIEKLTLSKFAEISSR